MDRRIVRVRWLVLAVTLVLSCVACGRTISPQPQEEQEQPGETTSPAESEQPRPPEAGLRRLTAVELRRSLQDLLGVTIGADIELDSTVAGYSTVGASTAGYSERGVETLDRVVSEAAEYVISDPARRARLLGCSPVHLSDPCVRRFLRAFGRRAWRRELDERELFRYETLAENAASILGDPWQGLAMAVAGLLESPHFAYRVELGLPIEDRPYELRYTGYEMAGRLSYAVWGTTPDEELLDAAAAGNLDSVTGVIHQVRRLFASPKAVEGIQRFFEEYWQVHELDRVSKSAEAFPAFSPSLAAAMREELMQITLEAALSNGANFLTLYTEPRGYVDPLLAELYGIRHPTGHGFAPVSLAHDARRTGVLSLGAFLTLHARSTRTSPTLRGRFIRSRILCDDIKDPPPGVEQAVDEDPSGATTLRDRLESHRSNAACASCHELMDPLGFAFEHFDAIGRYRETDNCLPIDTSGELDGVAFNGAAELGELLAESPRVRSCLVRQLYRYATGHVESEREEFFLASLDGAFAEANHSFVVLLMNVLTGDAFRFASVPE